MDNLFDELYGSFDIKINNINNKKEHCCSKMEIDIVNNDYICKNCKSIISKYLDNTAEWRCFEEQHCNPIRCGIPSNVLLPESSLGTVIGGSCSSTSMWLVKKCHLWTNNNYKERTLYNIFDNMFIKANNHGIPISIIEEAKNLYKELSSNNITRGNNKNGLIASAIYMACKNNDVPRSAKEIADIFSISQTVMTRGCKKFQHIINKRFKSCHSNDFINRYCSKLNLSRDMVNQCISISNRIDELNIISGHTPPSIAACSIYICILNNKLNIDKKIVIEKCEISLVTLTKCFKEIKQHTNLLTN